MPPIAPLVFEHRYPLRDPGYQEPRTFQQKIARVMEAILEGTVTGASCSPLAMNAPSKSTRAGIRQILCDEWLLVMHSDRTVNTREKVASVEFHSDLVVSSQTMTGNLASMK